MVWLLIIFAAVGVVLVLAIIDRILDVKRESEEGPWANM